MPEIPGYIVAETLRESRELVLLRGRRESDQSRILLESPAGPDLAPRARERMEREHSLREELDPAWALVPAGWERVRERPALVFEDPGGDLLSRRLREPRSPEESLKLAIRLCSALGKLHARGLVHKDVQPGNVWVDASGRVRLMGFGFASRLPRERPEPGPPEAIAGTWAYMSPEQTGRMNRSIDSRSDLYSLGATLYELFTGALPFAASDPLEWVHCHVARQPVPLRERDRKVPSPVSAVVMKLLAKAAEDRYQTAAGVEADLKRCLEDWERRGSIEPFPLGARDFPARLQVPEKLYGRERETRKLLEAFSRVEAEGRLERVFVSGYSGIGKSSLVHELHRALAHSRGLFAGGKFDPQRREEPYALFIQAFQSLTDRILAGTPEDLAAWRKAIQEAVGADGRVVADLIPELALLLGPQPAVPALSLLEARNRLHGVFAKFIGAFARREHPLVLFLDDLQWQDGAGLALFEHLATHPDLKHLLLVGAYRDAEVGPSHPLARALEAIRAADAGVTELRLAPLAEGDVHRLLADALPGPGQEVAPLARCVHEKTGGNPFFTLQFLRFLNDERLLGFDAERGTWAWDLERIRAEGITDNVAELVAGTLGRLPAEALEALQWMACLGASVETALLVRILDRAEGEVHAALRPAVLAGMVIPGGGRYRILHDRIQEVAYSLIPEPRRSDMHLAIVRRLQAGQAPEALTEAESLFLLVDQFNRGLERITEAAEREAARRLNALAGRKAMVSAAYGSASVYLAVARSLLPAEAWEREYPEALALLMDGAESDFMAGREDRAEALFGEILARARSRVDRARVFLLRVRVYQAAGRYQETVAACVEGLRILGAAIPPPDAGAIGAALADASAWVKGLLGGRRVADLADAPPATEAETPVFVALAAETLGPAHFSQSPYFPLLVHEGVRATLEQGPVAESAFLYSAFAILLSLGGEAEAGLEFSEMSLRLYARLGGVRARGALLFAQGALALWRHPFSDAAALLEEAVRAADRVGDVNTAGNAAVTALWARLEAGESLENLAEAAGHYLALARRTRTKPIEQLFLRILRFLESFQSSRAAAPSLGGRGNEAAADRDEEAGILEAFGKGGFSIGIAMIRIMNQMSAFILGRQEEAFVHGREAEGSLSPLLLTSHERYHPFFQALAAAALHEGAPPDRKKELAAVVAEKVAPLRRMAGLGPANYGNRLTLVQAEVARIEGRDLEAMRLYDQAIRSAREQGLVHHESLASEVAARFYRARGFETSAQAYFRNARAGYLRWGGTGKVKRMDRLHPGLEAPRAAVDADLGVSPEDLDLMAVVKASQAVSGEIVLERFLDSLLRIMLESAGAERGALLRPREEGFVVEAEAEAQREGIEIRMAEEAVSPDRFPASMLRFVSRTRERVLLDDAAAPGPFDEDPYVRARRPRSVLVLPLVKQGALVAVLYLENRLAPRAFTPGQAAVAQLLASQAAVSLENARLYRSLERAEERFSKAFRDSPIPMAIVRRKDEALLDANARFLATYGYPREELLGRSLRGLGLIDSEEADRLESLLAARGFLRDAEVPARNREAKPLSLLASLEPIDLDGEACALVTHVDITGRKQIEAQLRQSQKMEAIGRLAGGVAHDFNNLLTAINGFSGMVLEGLDASHPYYGYIREILKAGERAAALTRQLLAHSRMQVQQAKPWNLNDIVEDMVPMLRRLVGEDILLETGLAPDLRPAKLDRGQVEQILLNLVVNARDAIPGNGRIGIRTANVSLDQAYLEDHLEAAAGPHVMLSVSDTGCGMTPEVKAKLFEPFFTTKPVGKGTGLGLSVVYGIVKQSGGNLSVYSEPGMGTVFRVYFPEIAPAEGGERAREAAPDPASFRGHETVLLVEDAAAVRRFAALALVSQGYAVAEAGNGVEALKVLEARPDIRIVLTDVVMPDMGGATLATRLRALRPSLPIVFMSGFVEHAVVRDLVSASGERLLHKPFTPYELARAVREALDAAAKNQA